MGEIREQGSERPLSGVHVFVVGTRDGTVSDDSGRYRIQGVEPGDRRIRAELLGYGVDEALALVEPGETARADLVLVREYLRLDEMIVTGTVAGARAREVVHSVDRIDLDEILEPVATLDQLLMSRVPGVSVQPNSGLAGSGSQIRLRGNVSISLSNQPLVYVDGIRIRSDGYPENLPRLGCRCRGPNDTPSPLNDLNPADIERVEIVKGPAATTLYGTEAASGVIQIFTKRGEEGPPVWNLRIDQGFDRVLEFGTESKPFLGLDPWLDDAAWRERYALSVTGGGILDYHLSTSLDRSDGVLPNDRSRRFVVRANLDAEPHEDLSIRWSSSHAARSIENTAAGMNAHGLTFNVFRGDRNFVGGNSEESIAPLLEYDIGTEIDHTLLGLSVVHATTRSFTNRLTLGYDRAASRMDQIRPAGFVLAPDGVLYVEDWVNEILTAEYVGSLDLPLSGDLSTTISWGAQNVTSTVESDAVHAEGLPAGEAPTPGSAAFSHFTDSRVRVRNSGLFLQALLGYRDRYFLNGGLRVDGSTAFGEGLGLQSYPRIGVSYVLSEEPFWGEGWGRIKLRASYGHAGRAPVEVDRLRTWAEVDFGGDRALLPDAIGNPRLGPERTAETEVGVEAAFFDGRIAAELNHYDQRTTDALLPVSPIPSLGFQEKQLTNVGELRNRGVEISLRGGLLRRRFIDWEAVLYLHTNHSQVTDLGGAAPLDLYSGVGWILEDEPVPVLRGPRILNPHEIAEPVIEEDHLWGPNLPTRTVGFHSTIQLPRGVRFHLRAEHVGGHYIYDNISNSLARREVLAVCEDAYRLRASGHSERLTAWERVWCDADRVPTNAGPFYPADFLRLRELTLEVPVPWAFLSESSSILTVSARNFWTWKNDDFLLFDPEMIGSKGMHTRIRRIDAHVPPPASLIASFRMAH
ncbi:MAG: TonB-dependent receptor [Gemmatimonadota bacterium]|nr:TonB-dependent receptor [Gemmatimonadota bacterium]